ncbi:MAG TPA: DUF2520 domain-containing protein [Actinomycetota bacterium]
MAIIGAGRVGVAFGVLLERAGYHVVAASGRRASFERVRRYLPFAEFVQPHQAAAAADVILFAVPDDLIAPGCAAMAGQDAFRPGQFVLHTSGVMGLDALEPAAEAGAEILSTHPLQSFPEVAEGIERLPGSAIGVTARTERGAAFGEEVARAVGGEPFGVAEHLKPIYHAAAVFCSNYLVVVEGLAEELFALAGVEGGLAKAGPLARTAFEAVMERGPTAALTGPAARGDTGTVVRTLDLLADRAPDAAKAYAALAQEAARLAAKGGKLSDEGRRKLEEALEPWR